MAAIVLVSTQSIFKEYEIDSYIESHVQRSMEGIYGFL